VIEGSHRRPHHVWDVIKGNNHLENSGVKESVDNEIFTSPGTDVP